jgi:hypothetical protein
MIHVVCSKWGNKYPIEYVNRLHDAIQKHLPAQFNFYCQTDDTHGMLPWIQHIPFPNDLPECVAKYERNTLWDRPKLNYFNPDFLEKQDIKIAFDLDVIIHNDLTPILNIFKDKALTGRSWWHNMEWEAKPEWRKRYGARNNGGFYMWQGNQTKQIWDDLLKNWERIYFCFKGGSDNFLTTRHLDQFDFLPPSMFYSFNRGCEWPHDLNRHKIREDKIVCVFNTDPGDPSNLDVHEAIKVYPEIEKLWKLEQ